MPFTVNGDFGKARFSNRVDSDGKILSNYMSLNTEAGLNFFRMLTITKSDITNNSYGLFSFMKSGNNNKVRFANFNAPKHLLSKKKSGCAWLPKGKITMDVDETYVCPVEYNGQQCPDFNECLSKILAIGNQSRNLMATPEGRTIFAELMNLIYLGLGNSLYDLVWYGQHPIIDDSDQNDWYTVDDEEWADFIDQQDACVGLMTVVDHFKDEGYDNFNVEIRREDLSQDLEEYIGWTPDLFDRVLKAQSGTMKRMSKQASVNGRMTKSVLLVDPKVFEKYAKDLISQWPELPSSFQYYYNGKFCQAVGCDGKAPVEGVLRYKGHLVICMDEWGDFDEITGTKTCRVIAICPGNFGIAYDVDDLKQFKGQNLRISQHLEAPHQGMIYMDTCFRIGMSIINKNFIVNASRTFRPVAA